MASVSTRMVPFAWGTAYLNDGYRERWDSNFLWVDGTAEQVDAGALAAEAERVLGDAGLTHREIRIDDDAYGRSVAADLARAGYGGDRLVVMAQRRTPRPAGVGARGRGDRPGRAPSGARDRAAARAVGHVGRDRADARRLPGGTGTPRGRAVLLRAGRRRDRRDVRALRPGVDRPDRGREHPRGVPQPGTRARGGAARRRRGADRRARRRCSSTRSTTTGRRSCTRSSGSIRSVTCGRSCGRRPRR